MRKKHVLLFVSLFYKVLLGCACTHPNTFARYEIFVLNTMILIADEIATDLGVQGRFLLVTSFVTPDIMCLSKGLTGGYMPMALTITTPKIYDAFMPIILKGRLLCINILIAVTRLVVQPRLPYLMF